MMSPRQLADLLTDLVRADSPDPPGDESRVARILAEQLLRLGLEPEIDEFAPDRFNLLARVKGRDHRPGLIFSAHMDTLPPGNGTWRYPPYSGHNDGEKVYGRGAVDMKSGMAAMVAAAASIRSHGPELQGDLVLAFTGGESSNCLGARHLAATRVLENCSAILVSEPTSLELMIAEKAALWLRVTATGVTGHLSAGNEVERSAILAMIDALPRLSCTVPGGSHPLLGKATLNIGRIEGGTAINLTPDRCMVELDYRPLPGHNPDDIEQSIRSVLGAGFSVERLDFKPAVETQADHPFVSACREEAEAVRSVKLTPKGASYFTDACALSPAFCLPMAIIGPGLYGGSGMLDEHVRIDHLVAAAEIYRRIALRTLS